MIIIIVIIIVMIKIIIMNNNNNNNDNSFIYVLVDLVTISFPGSLFSKTFKQATGTMIPLVYVGSCNSDLIGFTYKMKKIKAEVDTTWKDLFCRCTIFRLAKPAFFRYNDNFTLVRDFYVACCVITGNK